MGTNDANADIKAMFKKSKPNPQKPSGGSSKKSSVKAPSKPQSSSKTSPSKPNSSSTPSNKSNQSKPSQKGSADAVKKPFAKKSVSKPPFKGNKDKAGGSSDKKKTWSKAGDKSWQKKRKAPAPAPPQSKKERRAAKKAKSAERPHGAELMKANEVWHIFDENVKKAERESKIGDILKELAGKLVPVCSKRDGSRAVEKMIKYGSAVQREQIYKELAGKMAEMSLDVYAHFVVIQLLRCDNEDIKKGVMQELLKKVTKLALHNTAGSVIDYMYASGKPKDKLRILAEFYGSEHALFAQLDDNATVSTLSEVLAAEPSKAPVILSSIQKYVDKCSTKDMFLFRPLHGLLAAYLPHAQPVSKEQLISICSGKVLALHHSQEGAGLVCECLGQGNAKSRKAVIKGLKGRVYDVSCHDFGHVILIRVLQVVDDIVLLNQGILGELKEHVEDLLVDPYGVKVLLYVVDPKLAGLETDSDRHMLAPALKNGELTSKKNPVIRRTEVFSRTITWLLPAIQKRLALISHNLACKVIFETIMHAYYMSDPAFAANEGKEVPAEELKKLAAVRAPLMQTVESLARMFTEEGNVSLLEDPNIHYHLKRLLTKTQPSGKEIASTFASAFLPLVSQPTLPPAWLSNRGAFLLTFILETDDQLAVPLKAHIAEIKKVESAGTKLLAQVLEESPEERAQRLATHKDEVKKSSDVPPTKELKKKKKKPKKRPEIPEGQENHGEYKDAAIVGMKSKAGKTIRVMSLVTAEKEKKTKEKEAKNEGKKEAKSEGKNVKIVDQPATKKAKIAEQEQTKPEQKKQAAVQVAEETEEEGDNEGDAYDEYDAAYDDAHAEGDEGDFE